ncbi:MAG: hypothetical protein GX568_03850, partial [Candidatus Gastranaerophilales bacterium]|nr:hypothetical protein [Candidatus Gastranaerophilales bacterium]
MLKFDWKNADAAKVGSQHGLEVSKEFSIYKDRIAGIVSDLYATKDTPGKWLKWMNLGYNDALVTEINEYAASVNGKFENLLVLGIGGSALGGICVTEALLKPYWNLLSAEQRNGFPRIFFVDNI